MVAGLEVDVGVVAELDVHVGRHAVEPADRRHRADLAVREQPQQLALVGQVALRAAGDAAFNCRTSRVIVAANRASVTGFSR